MSKESIRFKLREVKAVGFEEAKVEGWFTKEVKGKLFLELIVEEKPVGALKKVSKMVIHLNREGEEKTDVIFEELLKDDYVGKWFVIDELETSIPPLKWTGLLRNWLNIPRNAFHNIRVNQNPSLPVSSRLNYTVPDEATINAASDPEFDNLVVAYNKWIKENPITLQFNYYDKLIISGGTYYEINEEFGMNDYFNNTGKHDGKGMNQNAKFIGNASLIGADGDKMSKDPDDSTKDIPFREMRKKQFKRCLQELPTKLNEREKVVKLFKKLIADWLSKGNLTDTEHNKQITNWQKSWDENEIVQKYKELAGKVKNEAKYQRFEDKFKAESEREVEAGVAASKEPANLETPERITNPSTDPVADKIAKKNKFKAIRNLKNKVLLRKQAVIDLIDNLVANPPDDSTRRKCPQCQNDFTTTPINGQYCSQACADEAKNTRDNEKYTCAKCSKKCEKKNTPPVNWDGKNYCSQNCCNEAKKEKQNKDQSKDQSNKNLPQARTKAIQDINDDLNQDPKVLTSELDSEYKNWENHIKTLNDVTKINSFRDSVLSNINQKRTEKKNTDELKDEIKESKTKEGEDLKNHLKNIENKHQGTKGYGGQAAELEQEEARLFQEDPAKFKSLIKEVVENEMTKREITEAELGSEEKKLFDKIKKGEINDKDQLRAGKKKLVEFIGNKQINKKIASFEKQIAAAKNDKAKKEAIIKALRKLSEEDNVYVVKNKDKINRLIEKLESSSRTDTTKNPSSGIPWKIILPIVAVVIVGAIGFVLWKRKKRVEVE